MLLRLTICCAFSAALLAAQDAPECKDSPLVTRFPGSTLTDCSQKEFDESIVVVAVDKDENATEKKLEGAHGMWNYEGREGITPLQVFRNFQNAFRQAGFTAVYARSPDYQVVRKGNVWILVESSGAPHHRVNIVTVQEMTQEVTADASALKNELEKSGRVSVYGIQFETGKAAILPASEKVLAEVLKLLQESGDLKIRLEGHTDNVGAKALNQALSLQRAQSVMAWLTAKGIAAARMEAQGFGDTKPIADNTAEEGRAKNRRVDLVKR
jgi:outer membrane protein OmpA-like peptidoglycan-associated protein